MATSIDLARLQWQCRRGMLELDLLLQGFLAKEYEALAEDQKQAFQRLLKTADQQLLEYLMGREPPQDKEIADVVTKIRRLFAD